MDAVSRRINPRSVILEYLKGGPFPAAGLIGAFDVEIKASSQHGWINRTPRSASLIARHLCHLIRGGRVRRRDDGLYELRYRKPRWAFHCYGADETAASLRKMSDGLGELRDAFTRHMTAGEDIDPGTLVYIGSDGLARGKAD